MLEGRNIDRKSSIESEPMTLTMNQIHFAREAALYVMQTRSMEEAMNIFTEGLKPVVSVVGMKLGHQKSCFEFLEEDDPELRDVVTAPF